VLWDYFVGALLPNDRDPAGPNVPLRGSRHGPAQNVRGTRAGEVPSSRSWLPGSEFCADHI